MKRNPPWLVIRMCAEAVAQEEEEQEPEVLCDTFIKNKLQGSCASCQHTLCLHQNHL